MALFSYFSSVLLQLIGALVAAAVIQWASSYHKHGLFRVPGPGIASITDLNRVWHGLLGDQLHHHLRLHRKYGEIVRVGPNCVSLSNGELLTQIYGTSGKFCKSGFYQHFDAMPGLPTIFSIQDEVEHKAMARQLGTAYSTTSMCALEFQNDACTKILVRKLEEKAAAGICVNLDQWLHWYASDVITSITFSNRLGFLEQEQDVGGLNKAVYRRMQYLSVVGQLPSLRELFLRSPLITPLVARFDRTGEIIAFAREQVERFEESEANNQRNLLSLLKERGMSKMDMLVHATTNIFAGSDTTGITLTALFYHILQNHQVYRTLQKEVLDAFEHTPRLVTFEEAQKMPYLQAVIKETLRIHPPVGMLLERTIPQEGMNVAGIDLPEGTTIGMNPWVVARDPFVYPDADEFRPERWLQAGGDQLKLMNRNFLAFGGGSRVCTGKAISLIQISKVVPELLRRFDFELEDDGKPEKMYDYFFVWQSRMKCRIRCKDGDGQMWR